MLPPSTSCASHPAGGWGRIPRTLEVGACPVCGARRSSGDFESPDRMHGIPGAYRYRRCQACRTVYQDPRVVDEDLGLLYPGSYYTHRAESASPASGMLQGRRGAKERIRSAVQRARAPGAEDPPVPWWGRALACTRWMRERAFYDLVADEMLPWQKPAGRALDVGCGSGAWMARLAAVGWEVTGLEPDEKAAALARERTGAEVHIAPVGALHREDLGDFDLITVVHVLEHLPFPGQALGTLAALLRPGGRIVVICPNPDALAARLFGPYWFAWDAPRHLVLPSLRARRHLLAGTGLQVRRARTLARWAADHAMQSAAYRQGRGLQAGVPDLWHRGFGALERLMVGLGLNVGEEIVLHLEARP